MKTRFCRECGAEIPSGAAFCPGCGRDVRVDAEGSFDAKVADCSPNVKHTAAEQWMNSGKLQKLFHLSGWWQSYRALKRSSRAPM